MNGFADLDAVTRDAASVWAGDAALRAEFRGNKESYLAFRRAEARGQTRVLGRGVTAFVKVPVQTSAPGQPDDEWAGDAALRAEFGGNKEAYLAFRRAEQDGRAKIFSPGAASSQTRQAPLQPLAIAPTGQAAFTLAERQTQVRQENVGRQFAGLPVLPIPQE